MALSDNPTGRTVIALKRRWFLVFDKPPHQDDIRIASIAFLKANPKMPGATLNLASGNIVRLATWEEIQSLLPHAG